MTTDDFIDDLDEILEGATPRSQDVTVCLDGSKHEERDALVRATVQAESPDDRLGAKSSASKAQDALAAFDETLRKRLVTVRAVALEGTEWSGLKTKFKPRKDNDRDRAVGFNIEAVCREALLRNGKRVVHDGDQEILRDIKPGQWETLFRKMSGGDFDLLIHATFGVNQLGSQALTASLVKGSPATSISAGK